MSATRTYEHKHAPQTETLHQAGAELRSAPPRLVTERSRQRSSPPVPQKRARKQPPALPCRRQRHNRSEAAPPPLGSRANSRERKRTGLPRGRGSPETPAAQRTEGQRGERPCGCGSAAPARYLRGARRKQTQCATRRRGEKPRRALTCAPAAPRLLAPPPPSGGTTCRITPGGQIAASSLLMPRAFEASTAEPPACFPEGHRQSLGAGEKRFRSSGFPPPSPGFAPSWSRPVEAARLCLSSEVGLRPRGLLLP